MAVLNTEEIIQRLNMNGYSIELAYQLLLSLREASNNEDNNTKRELQIIARDMYELAPNKSKNVAKVLRAISNNTAYNTQSIRARMLEADCLVDKVVSHYDSKESLVDAFGALIHLKNTYKHRSFFQKLFGSETRALNNRIHTLTSQLSNRFGNALVGNVINTIMNNGMQVEEISAMLPDVNPLVENEEKVIRKGIEINEGLNEKASQASKEDELARKDIENYIVKPKPENDNQYKIDGLPVSKEEYFWYLKSQQEIAEFYPEQKVVNPLFEGVMEAFYPVYDKYKDNYDEYCNTLLNRTVDVQLNEKNLEYVLLATYKMEQLNEIKSFIENSPNKNDLEYLVRPLNYKISHLMDTSLVDTTINDQPVQVEAYKNFIIHDVQNNYLESVKSSLDKDITSYEAFSNNVEIMHMDATTNKTLDERLDAIDKYDSIKENPSMTTKEQAIVGKDSLLIPLPKMEHQSSDNGCWSCSLQAQLNHFGVNLNQTDLRSLRPTYDTSDASKNPLVTLRNRISFSYLANRDEKVSMIDYAEVIHKTVQNSVVHHSEICFDFFGNVKALLDKYKTPISCTNGVHYLTIVGYDGDKLIYQDSLRTDPVKHYDGISPELHEKYKNYCVGDCSEYVANMLNRGMELTWIERYNTKEELKAIIKGNNLEYNNSIIRGTSSSCFNKIENPLDPFTYMNTNIIISNSDARELGLGPFEKQALNLELNINDEKEEIPVINEEDNEFFLLK